MPITGDRYEVWLGKVGEGAHPMLTVRTQQDGEAIVANWRAEAPGNVGSVYRISPDEVYARKEWYGNSVPAREAKIAALPIGDPPSLAVLPWDHLPENVRRWLGKLHEHRRLKRTGTVYRRYSDLRE